VLELSDVAGPVVAFEDRDLPARQPHLRALEPGAGQAQQMSREDADVRPPLP
jgi:hypothetical protein